MVNGGRGDVLNSHASVYNESLKEQKKNSPIMHVIPRAHDRSGERCGEHVKRSIGHIVTKFKARF